MLFPILLIVTPLSFALSSEGYCYTCSSESSVIQGSLGISEGSDDTPMLGPLLVLGVGVGFEDLLGLKVWLGGTLGASDADTVGSGV